MIRRHSAAPGTPQASRPSLPPALLVGVFFLCIYLVSGSSDLKHNGDTDLRYQTTQALVDYHRLWIAHPMWLDTRVATGVGGHLYAFYAPGQTLLMVPFYVAGKFLAHHLALPYDVTTLYASRSLDLVLGAILAVVFFLLALSVGYSTGVAVVLTLIFGLTTVVWPDAQSALEQTQVNLLLLLAVFAAWNFVKRDLNDRRWLAAAGTAAGLALFTRYDAVLYLPIIILYPALIRWVKGRRGEIVRDVSIYALSALPWAAGIAVWNYARFGSPFLTGLHERTFGEPPWSGFLGLTISPGKGLIWYLPLLLLLPWAVSRFYRRRRSLFFFLATLVAATLLFYSNVLYWHGDPAWGPRYLYVVVPYLVLPLGEIFTTWRQRSAPLRTVLIVLIGVGLVLQASAVSVTQWRFWYRLQVAGQGTSSPFRWGAQYYHYYWNLQDSPIRIQLDDVYQVLRLDLGEQRYRLAAKPADPYVSSNPAQEYPVNTLAFWWSDVRHPLLDERIRVLIAFGLAAGAAAALALLMAQLLHGRRAARAVPLRDLELTAGETAGQ